MLRLHLLLRGLLILFPCAASVAALAQFAAPIPQELAMTADPKAPGASAVCLYREDVTDGGKRTRIFYERIKVLTEKGKELASMDAPDPGAFGKIDIQGRTIHADGTIVPLTDKPVDVSGRLVFTLPSVEVGSILEYRVTIKFESYDDFAWDPQWVIQQSYFVHKAHYSYKTSQGRGRAFIARIGKGAKVMDDKKGTYTLDVEDVEPRPNFDWMPPLNTTLWSVDFFLSDYTGMDAFWGVARERWAKFVIDYTKPTGIIKLAVATMIAPTDTETQKAQKIYAAVLKLRNTDFSRTLSKAERKKEKLRDIHNAQDVWRDQIGNSDEIALLFVALCRAAGLDVSPMRVVNRDRALFDPAYLTSGQLDDYIAVARLDGKEVYLDPGQKVCPFGLLHWKHALATGFRLTDKTAAIARTPAISSLSVVQRIADLTLAPSGDVEGSLRVVLGGQDALLWRQVSLQNDEEEVKKQFNEALGKELPDGVHGEFDHFLGLEDYNSSLMANVRVHGSLGTVTGKRIFLPAQFFAARAAHPFVKEEKRTIAVDVEYARKTSDDVTYRAPAGYAFDSIPAASKIEWAGKAQLEITSTTDAGSVDIVRDLMSAYVVVDARDYDQLHQFYQKLATADAQQVVLVRSAAPAAASH